MKIYIGYLTGNKFFDGTPEIGRYDKFFPRTVEGLDRVIRKIPDIVRHTGKYVITDKDYRIISYEKACELIEDEAEQKA